MFEKIFIVTLIVWGVHVLFWDSMILGFISRWLMYRIPVFIIKPLYACPVCMTPYYGTIVYIIMWKFDVADWGLTLFASMGLSGIIVSFIPETITIEDDDSPGEEDIDPRHN